MVNEIEVLKPVMNPILGFNPVPCWFWKVVEEVRKNLLWVVRSCYQLL